jgi:transposase
MKELSQIWSRIQGTLLPFLNEELDPISEKQGRLIAILELVRIEDAIHSVVEGLVGRPRKDRQAMARAFIAKAFYNMGTTEELIERLKVDRNLRRICGWERKSEIPSSSTFSRSFAEFAQMRLGELVHKELIEEHLSEKLVGHVGRDSTEIEAREKPVSKPPKPEQPKKKRGRPRKGEERPKEFTALEKQQQLSLYEMLGQLPTACDYGSKKDSKGFKHSWIGYKLHIDTADGEIPLSCILTSASVHDSQAALPLMRMTSERVTSLYDLMDAAYDARIIREESEALGHVAIIDSNPRGGEKVEFDPAKKERYKARSQSERVNGRLKDEFGARNVRVRGAQKIMAHLMFGVVVLAADQLLRLVT